MHDVISRPNHTSSNVRKQITGTGPNTPYPQVNLSESEEETDVPQRSDTWEVSLEESTLTHAMMKLVTRTKPILMLQNKLDGYPSNKQLD